jgi:nitroreductase
MNISLEAVMSRSSVRSYEAVALPADTVAAIEAAFHEATPGPFGHLVRFRLVSRPGAGGGAGAGKAGKIGTYGLITGATAFVAGVVGEGDFACVDFGYCLEGVVLRATELGLGTCWLGGIFDRAAVLRVLEAKEGEFCPATTPVGFAAKRPSLQDRFIRRQAGSNGRKDGHELFFAATPEGAWTRLADAGHLAPVLEAVRVGPSASNKQPWRLIVDRRGGAEALHLYLHEDQRYNNLLGRVKLQELDMGIAMRHVEVAAAEFGIRGVWKRLDAVNLVLEAPRRYIASFG